MSEAAAVPVFAFLVSLIGAFDSELNVGYLNILQLFKVIPPSALLKTMWLTTPWGRLSITIMPFDRVKREVSMCSILNNALFASGVYWRNKLVRPDKDAVDGWGCSGLSEPESELGESDSATSSDSDSDSDGAAACTVLLVALLQKRVIYNGSVSGAMVMSSFLIFIKSLLESLTVFRAT